jgi:hypothetical protein
MKRIVRSLFALSMVAGILGIGSSYSSAQDGVSGSTTQTYYGTIEIVPGIRLTPDSGTYELALISEILRPQDILENVIRPDGTFLFKFRSRIRGYKTLAVLRGVRSGERSPDQIVTQVYFSSPTLEKYPNPTYPFSPAVSQTNGQAFAQRLADGGGGIQTLSFEIDTAFNVGTIVLAKPGSITGRIILVDSPAVNMADLVIAIPQFGLVTKPNPDGGYLLTGVPPGTWNARLMGPGIRETRDTIRLTYVAAMNPTVGVNFTIRGQNVPAASQVDPSNAPPITPVLQGIDKDSQMQDQKEPAKTADKPSDKKTPAEIEKEKAIKDLLNKIPIKKP